ncbi:lipase 1-like [Euwallacea fornicatus]|uniref:lipase 1-like n=1 Tax=Euwallacea fornicatus TaxID=995702 RepID=UPI00338D4359
MAKWMIVAMFHFISVALDNLTGVVFHLQAKTTVDIIKEHNYPVEIHSVITDDGYVLTLHRIPHGKTRSTAPEGPVLLMHGLLCSSADWVVLEENSLAFILADAGFDVWMGNNRGNTYSRNNIYINPIFNERSFFDFSYHDLGLFDLPAMIDFILVSTNTTKIGYVGFSEGTTQFFVMTSELPEYNSRIKKAVFWAPVTDMYRISNGLINLLAQYQSIEMFGNFAHLYELFAHATVGYKLRAFCKIYDTICSLLFNRIGSSFDRMPNKALKDKILQNFPAGMSLKQLYHYVQGARSGVFRPYDYGPDKNLEIYHKLLPDPYNLSRFTVPTTIYYGDSDVFVNNEILRNDVVANIPTATLNVVPLPNFNHLDFIYSTTGDWLTNATLNDLLQDDEKQP